MLFVIILLVLVGLYVCGVIGFLFTFPDSKLFAELTIDDHSDILVLLISLMWPIYFFFMFKKNFKKAWIYIRGLK